ncbi:MFS general substrate transporter [Panaeolus papilionaceus]|nr:MFS general substrate transporter [Panaeolus papilionaceus]
MHSTPDQNLTPELKVIPSNSTTSGDDAKPEPPIDKELERKAVLKLDYTVLPMMALFYFLNFMDRANIGNARIAGLQKDLHLTDHEYQVCVAILYVTYMVFEMPSNLILRKIGPHILLPAIVTAWGITVTAQGFVKSYAGLIIIRLILGALEGPLFPGMVLYLSGFYTRTELSMRIAFFFSTASLSGAFSGLLAAALTNLHGVGNLPGWSWIFIIEGLITVLVGVLGFYFVPKSPRESRYLSPDQIDCIYARLERDNPLEKHAVDNFSLKQMAQSMLSPHVVMACIMFFCSGSNVLGLANFLPSIVKQLGFSPVRSQLLTVGPFGAAFFFTLLISYYSDKYQSRGIPMIILACVASIGYIIYLCSHKTYTLYGSLFFLVSGSYPMVPLGSGWASNNSEPHYRRATTIGLCFFFSSAGTILSTWRFPTKEGPRFTKTTIMTLSFAIVTGVLAVVNMIYLNRQNKLKVSKREELLAPYRKDDEKNGYDEAKAWIELGDRHPDFKYIL